jgi:hypothetical protein
MQVEVKECRAYGARTTLGQPSPSVAGLPFCADRLLEKHFQDEPAELQIPLLRSADHVRAL